MAYELKTFKDIVDAICEEVGIQASDLVARNRIKRDVNIIYLQEIVPFERWNWIRGEASLTLQNKITTGTATVTQNSQTVTLTTAPGFSVRGYYFSVEGQSERYLIQNHSSSSFTLELESIYTSATTAGVSYAIWTDRLPLPQDCRETIEVTCDAQNEPLEGLGLQKFRRYVSTLPKADGVPKFYSTNSYVDAIAFASITGLPASVSRSSSGLIRTLNFASSVASLLSVGNRIRIQSAGSSYYDGEWQIASVSSSAITFVATTNLVETTTADTAFSLKLFNSANSSERYRELWVYPSFTVARYTIHVDYIKEVAPLEDDEDEPLIPVSDRIVLLYGALSRGWYKERNPEASKDNQALYDRKLSRMAGKLDDSTDTPILRPSRVYLRVKRQASRFRDPGYGPLQFGASGSSSVATTTGTANTAAIFDSTGALIGSTLITTTELNQLDGITSGVVALSDVQTLTNKTMSGSSNTFTNLPASGLSGTVPIANGGTGAATKAAGFDALSPTTTRGDLIARGASVNARLAIGAANTVLQTDGTDPLWAQIADAQIISTASIARTKVAVGTASHVVINSGTGAFSSEATLAKSRGGTGADNSSVTFPSSGVIVTETASETLTNKTLTAPVISTISNTGTLTLPTSTDTLVGKATTDTLTNKTLTTPTINQPVINGVTANTAAAAGVVGEVLSSNVVPASAVSLTNATPANVTSVSLTQGWWRASAAVQFRPAAGTSVTDLDISINTTSATLAGASNRGNYSATGQIEIENASSAFVPGGPIDQSIPPYTFYVASTTTYYLVAQALFSVSTMTANGFVHFERFR